jgi:hypothetical protein
MNRNEQVVMHNLLNITIGIAFSSNTTSSTLGTLGLRFRRPRNHPSAPCSPRESETQLQDCQSRPSETSYWTLNCTLWAAKVEAPHYYRGTYFLNKGHNAALDQDRICM